jgi:ribosomal protein L40E
MRYQWSKIKFYVVILIVWLNIVVNLCGTSVANDDLEIGDYIIYNQSIKESGRPRQSQFKIYDIEYIDDSHPSQMDVYASVYLSDMPTGGWEEVDVWKHLASINSLSYVGNILYDPTYPYSSPSTPFIWTEFLQDILSESSFTGLTFISSSKVTKFRTIWMKSGYIAKIEADTETWFSTETELWVEKNVHSKLFIDLKISQYFSSSGIMVYRNVKVDIEHHYEKYHEGFSEDPFETGTERSSLRIISKIDSEHSTLTGIEETPWRTRNWVIILTVIIGVASVSTLVLKSLRKPRKNLKIQKMTSKNALSPSPIHQRIGNKQNYTNKQTNSSLKVIICPKCGIENSIHANSCFECKGSLWDIQLDLKKNRKN